MQTFGVTAASQERSNRPRSQKRQEPVLGPGPSVFDKTRTVREYVVGDTPHIAPALPEGRYDRELGLGLGAHRAHHDYSRGVCCVHGSRTHGYSGSAGEPRQS
jgi:hypothetical protein